EHPDRPTEPDVHERVVETLERHGIRATFFVQGRWAEAYPARVRVLASAAHRIGSHGFFHAEMPLLSPDGLREDVRRAEAVIREVAGVETRPWFRLPFGIGEDDESIHAALGSLGYRHVPWHADGEDWAPDANSHSVAEALVAGAIAHGDGAILLLHSW